MSYLIVCSMLYYFYDNRCRNTKLPNLIFENVPYTEAAIESISNTDSGLIFNVSTREKSLKLTFDDLEA